LQDVTFALDNN